MTDALLDRHDALLLDLDGTVYRGTEPVAGAADAIERARLRGTPLRFVTNNASKAPEAVVEHLRSVGIPATPDEVNTSAQAAAQILRERLPAGAPVLVVGTAALTAQVENAGFEAVRATGDGVAAVVQGHSPETGWADLAEACLAIRSGALWVACNNDTTLPAERGLLPGNGAMVAALRAATDQEPLVAGKPEPPLFRTAADTVGARNALVAGDRLDTDIAGALAAGLDALVVLTGVATPESLLAASPAERPRYLAADLDALDEPADALEIGPRDGWTVRVEHDVLVATSDAGRNELDLLRALCDAAWRHGTGTVRPGDEVTAAAFGKLGLA
ncbi:HAD-IIA family hydrolase [Prauserella oleivorans]|uniref:HAD-IIA family hydrolase n=1 Tax=Prauserella oleivorans TaxID=1478153 RepID=A0ABW5W6R9_9PSEU